MSKESKQIRQNLLAQMQELGGDFYEVIVEYDDGTYMAYRVGNIGQPSYTDLYERDDDKNI